MHCIRLLQMLREQSRQKCKTLRYIVNQSNIHIHLYKTGCRSLDHNAKCVPAIRTKTLIQMSRISGAVADFEVAVFSGTLIYMVFYTDWPLSCSLIFHLTAFVFEYATHSPWHHSDELIQCHNIYFRPELHSFSPRSYIGDGSVGRCVKSSRALPKDSQWG